MAGGSPPCRPRGIRLTLAAILLLGNYTAAQESTREAQESTRNEVLDLRREIIGLYYLYVMTENESETFALELDRVLQEVDRTQDIERLRMFERVMREILRPRLQQGYP
jgi:hypothetical protein